MLPMHCCRVEGLQRRGRPGDLAATRPPQVFGATLTFREAYPSGDTDFHKSLQLYRSGGAGQAVAAQSRGSLAAPRPLALQRFFGFSCGAGRRQTAVSRSAVI